MKFSATCETRHADMLSSSRIQDSENCHDSNAVIISYPSLILVVTIGGESDMCTYDPRVFLIPEMDCVRILTNNYHEVIQKVPNSVYNIFAINSDKPASFLFEAHKKYEDKSQKSDEYLCMIKGRLDESVSECVEAASYEFDTETQKSLIRAAYFGKAFIPSHNPDEYIKISRVLRVLNALRDPKIGIPLTYKQYVHSKEVHFISSRIDISPTDLAILGRQLCLTD